MDGQNRTLSAKEEERESLWKNKMGPVEGIYLPPERPWVPTWKDKIEELRQMTLRDDDVILLTYPKSGTHWLWELINMLRRNTTEPDKHSKAQMMMEYISTDVLDDQPSPRTLNTHLPFCLLPVEGIKSRRLKMVHMYRNIKDVCVSLYHMTKSFKKTSPFPDNFPDFLQDFLYGHRQMYGSYFSYLRQIDEFQQQNPDVPVFSLAYEYMKKNPVESVKQLAQFLGLSASDEFCQQVADACSFDSMKRQEAAKETTVMTNEAVDPEVLQRMKQVTSVTIYRKGQIGDWKNHFTVAENERADILIQQEVAKGLPFTLTFE